MSLPEFYDRGAGGGGGGGGRERFTMLNFTLTNFLTLREYLFNLKTINKHTFNVVAVVSSLRENFS